MTRSGFLHSLIGTAVAGISSGRGGSSDETVPILSLADRLIKPVPFELGGQTWGLLITYGVLLETERITGFDMLRTAEHIVNPNAATLRCLIWAMLARQGCTHSIKTVGRLLGLRNQARARDAVREALRVSMPKPSTKKKADSEDSSKEGMDWPETWASARLELHLSDIEFIGMTPLQFHELRKSFVRIWQHEEFLFSRLTARMINFSHRAPEKPIDDEFFMIHPFEDAAEEIPLGDQIMNAIGRARNKKETKG